jgi:hypothetical protein
MSHASRPPARGPAPRPKRQLQIEAVQPLEERQLLAPVLSTTARTATFTAATTPTNPFLGTVTINQGAVAATSAAAFTSVAQLTPISSFGGDIVRIEAGPGGDFGKGVYAVSRGAGGNTGAVNRPGVVYRVDPATGKASVFFDLNTVISRVTPGGTAANSLGAETGLVNWYDIAFDPEGYFDGKTSMFLSSVDRTDPNKNIIYRIGPDGSFLGAYVTFTDGFGAGAFTRSPSSILVPPPEQQSFLRGLVMGDGAGTSGFVGLFFDANAFRPGTNLGTANLPAGVSPTGLFLGPQVGLASTSSTIDYSSQAYSAFTDFGTPAGPGIAAQPGLSGVQGLSGDVLINGGQNFVFSFTDTKATSPDTAAAIITPFRRFQDVAYDAYGYFSYGTTVTVAGNTVTVGAIPPAYVGNLFVSDLATGLTVNVSPQAPLPTTPTVNVPIQGPGAVGVSLDAAGNVVPITSGGNTTGGSNIGGRIVRISPTGVVSNFAEGFNTSGNQGSQSFIDSSLSITFSADGTALYAADNDGIWQFKSTLSLAGSTTGSLVGLNDLRSLGVPYQGQDSAVAVLDTGIDALNPYFRGRVANGKNIFTNGPANDDPTAAQNGHGTLIAGVVAQFVPQATLTPVNIFTPNQVVDDTGTIQATSSQAVYRGMQWITQNPFTKDPVRPNKADRIISTVMGFGTSSTFDTEGSAFRKYKQIVLSLKSQASRMRRLGIAPIAAAGQFGVPQGSTQVDATLGDQKGMSLPAVLNEVISVTGTYPFPYANAADASPDDPSPGVLPRPVAPVILVGNDTAAGTGAELLGNAGVVGVGDQLVYKDKLLVAANRGLTTDFAAPAVDIPTFRRTFVGDASVYNVFQEAGTSLSAGVMTGSYAVVASAIDYWSDLAQTPDGVSADAYLNMPVGTRTLTFGTHGVLDLRLYANPDAINSILQWTAVPATDNPNTLDLVNPPALFGNENFRNFARVDVGNAIAAIEGAVALDYLFAKGGFDVIDGNKNGLITAEELQTFVDRAATIGLPEMGAMARFLGGTDTTSFTRTTAVGELPDQPDVLQRRFNFFDYASDGELNGVVSLEQYRVLAHKLLPAPDSFVINDRQRSSINGFLLDPKPYRNTSDLQHTLPKYAFVPASVARRFQNISPGKFHVGRGQLPATVTPFYTLFEPGSNNAGNRGNGRGNGGNGGNNSGGNNSGGNNSGGGNTGGGSQSGGGSQGGGGGGTTNSAPVNQAPTVVSPAPTTPANGDRTQQFVSTLVQALRDGQAAPAATGRTTSMTRLGAATPAASTRPGGVPAGMETGSDATPGAGDAEPGVEAMSYAGVAVRRAGEARQRIADQRQQLRLERMKRIQTRIAYEKAHPPKEKSGWEKFVDAIDIRKIF